MTGRPSKNYSKTIFFKIAGVGAALLTFVVIIYFGFFNQTEELDSGNIRVECLGADVEVITGLESAPHITASNLRDLFRTIGYLQASRQLKALDRLLRIATGQMAAAHGKRCIGIDIAARRLGFLERGKRVLAQLSPEAQMIFTAYCEGINAYIVSQRHSVAQNFHLSGNQPLPWTPEDCLAILHLWRWTYSCRWDEKIVVYKTGEVFGRERITDGFPLLDQWTMPGKEYQDIFFTTLNEFFRAGLDLRRAAAMIPGQDRMLTWALAGENPFAGQVGLFFENNCFDAEKLAFSMSIPGWQLSGIFFPGTPLCWAGGNRQVAWGCNWPDDHVVDFLAAQISPKTEKYSVKGNWQNLIKRIERIEVKNDRDIDVKFYHTDQGIVLDHILQETDSIANAIVLKWAGLSASAINNQIALMLTRNLAEFKNTLGIAGSDLSGLVWTVMGGDFGIIPEPPDQPLNSEANCLISLRLEKMSVANHSESKWSGGLIMPEPEMRRFVSVVDFNQPQTSCPLIIAKNFSMLNKDQYFDGIIKDIQTAISDTLFEREIELSAYQNLIGWDGIYSEKTIGATIYRSFLAILLRNVYSDELSLVDPETFQQFINSYDFALSNLRSLIKRSESGWFDNLRTPEIVEWQGEMMRRSFREAVQELEARYSPNMSEWQWGRVSRDFQVAAEAPKKRVAKIDPVRIMAMNAAGSETKGFITTIGAESYPVEYTALFRDRYEMLRSGAQILTLKTSSEKSPE